MEVHALSVCRPAWVQEVLNSYETDATAQSLLTQLAIVSPDAAGFALEQGLIKYKGRLWIADNTALQTKLISALHESAVGGALGYSCDLSASSQVVLLARAQGCS